MSTFQNSMSYVAAHTRFSAPEADWRHDRSPTDPANNRVLYVVAVLVLVAAAILGAWAASGADTSRVTKPVPNANPTNTTLRWPYSEPKTSVLVPQTQSFSATAERDSRFRFNDGFVEVLPGEDDSIALAAHSKPAIGIVGTLQNASNGTGLAVRVQDEGNMWVLVPAPRFGAFSLVRVAGGKTVETYAMPLVQSAPGTAVGLVNQPDRIEAIVNGVVRLEVKTTDLAEFTTVGVATLGGEAGSWRALAAWR